MSMAKTRRVKKARTTARKQAGATKRPKVARRRPVRTTKSSPKAVARPARKAAGKPASKVTARTVKPAEPPAPPAPPPAPVRKPTYHEAVALYERGLQALQRRDFAASADALRLVIERYPDERELLERARLYLKVCERELEPKEPAPKTADEWVYAATVSLNAGDETTALRHLQRAVSEDARHDHAHYMMAVAAARRRDLSGALNHLRQSIALNPQNRSLARQDPELDGLRDEPAFKAVLDAPASDDASSRPAAARTRMKPRR